MFSLCNRFFKKNDNTCISRSNSFNINPRYLDILYNRRHAYGELKSLQQRCGTYLTRITMLFAIYLWMYKTLYTYINSEIPLSLKFSICAVLLIPFAIIGVIFIMLCAIELKVLHKLLTVSIYFIKIFYAVIIVVVSVAIYAAISDSYDSYLIMLILAGINIVIFLLIANIISGEFKHRLKELKKYDTTNYFNLLLIKDNDKIKSDLNSDFELNQVLEYIQFLSGRLKTCSRLMSICYVIFFVFVLAFIEFGPGLAGLIRILLEH